MKRFQMDRLTYLATDFSRKGLGFFLLQQACQCNPEKGPNCGQRHWKLVLACSWLLEETESRYSSSEGEWLAIVFGIEQCRLPKLLRGHRPLALDSHLGRRSSGPHTEPKVSIIEVQLESHPCVQFLKGSK